MHTQMQCETPASNVRKLYIGVSQYLYYLHHLLHAPHSLIWRNVKRLPGALKADKDPHGWDICPPSVAASLWCYDLWGVWEVWGQSHCREGGRSWVGKFGKADYSMKWNLDKLGFWSRIIYWNLLKLIIQLMIGINWLLVQWGFEIVSSSAWKFVSFNSIIFFMKILSCEI